MKLPYFLAQPAVAVPLLAAGLVASLAPNEWSLSRYWPSSFLGFLSECFPPISGYASQSDFPEITRMYMSITYLMVPLFCRYAYLELSAATDAAWYKNLWHIGSRWAFVKRAGLVVVVGAITYFLSFVNPGYDLKLMPLHTSRTALAFWGWMIAGGIQGALLAWVFCNLLVFQRFCNRR